MVLNGKTLVNGTDYEVTYADNTNAGTAKVKITGINAYSGTIDKTFQIRKAAQEVKSVTPKSGAIKKVALGKSFKIKAAASKEQGTAQFKKVSGNKKLKISSTGKVTAEKGLKKGKTYTLKYKVRIKATRNCKATKYVTRTVKIRSRSKHFACQGELYLKPHKAGAVKSAGSFKYLLQIVLRIFVTDGSLKIRRK